MTAADDQITAMPSFRQAMAAPVIADRAVEQSTDVDLDTTMTKILLDYKRGRQHQAAKRFRNLITHLGFDVDLPLIHQSEKLDEGTACLLIFELLFLINSRTTPTREQLWQYVDSVALFDPDDVICHGAIYNITLVFFFRDSDMAAAFQLAETAMKAYLRCNSDYLQFFVHLHIAHIHIYDGRLSDADSALDHAHARLQTCGAPVCENAMLEITRHWVRAEAGAALPDMQELCALGEQIIEGEFWPDIFLVLAALQLRTGLVDGRQDLAELHSANEFTLRNRSLQPMLPAMQLLREECLHNGKRHQRQHPLNLPEHQLMLLLPTLETWRQNIGEEPECQPRLKRICALHEMHLAQLWRKRGRFDLTMEHFIPAMEIITTHGFSWLAASEADFITEIAHECRKRNRFVEKARGWLSRFGAPDPCGSGPEPQATSGLTPTELGVLRRLPLSTSNKALALALGVSESTVKYHLKNIYRKLDVHKRREAIDVARIKGLL